MVDAVVQFVVDTWPELVTAIAALFGAVVLSRRMRQRHDVTVTVRHKHDDGT